MSCTLQVLGICRACGISARAMPMLRELYLDLFFISSDRGLDMGMEYLPLLQDVFIEFRSDLASTEEVDQAKATLRSAAEIHPNHPHLTIYSDQVD